jgi:hypothetical protein
MGTHTLIHSGPQLGQGLLVPPGLVVSLGSRYTIPHVSWDIRSHMTERRI